MLPTAWTDGVTPFLVLLFAFALEALNPVLPLAPARSPHPLVLTGRLAGELARRLDRSKRGEAVLIIRGALLLLVFAALAGALGWLVERWTRAAEFGWAVELVIVALVIEARGTARRARLVARALDTPRKAARLLEAHFGARPAGEDRHAVARAAVEAGASRFAGRLVAPVLWYALLGLPGLLVHGVAETLSAAIGRRPGAGAFGLAIRRFEEALAAIPARLAVPVLALAALAVPRASTGRALATAWADHGRHSGLNDGWPIGAVAGALDLSLGTPGSWIGGGRARAEPADIARARYLLAVACLVVAAPLAGAAAYFA